VEASAVVIVVVDEVEEDEAAWEVMLLLLLLLVLLLSRRCDLWLRSGGRSSCAVVGRIGGNGAVIVYVDELLFAVCMSYSVLNCAQLSRLTAASSRERLWPRGEAAAAQRLLKLAGGSELEDGSEPATATAVPIEGWC